ncbi:MAG TPA: phospholipid carrier-dependent glycosyltransferase [Candidatus Peribacteraceae bacterium]|nr:phospholipid carrier-dependent glycosyltransferase [Candidatus Peribacteraceae bacterium]
MTDFRQLLNENKTWLALMFVIVCGFFTYVYNYQNPPALFWDENYHIASAQKYLNGVYFMEPHPPLAKLLIALGEKIVHANPVDNQFIGTDYAQNPPAGFSFAGYRLFPVLLAWWTAPILFLIFLILTRRTLWALLFDFLYLFDNALIVHQRSAMLESTMLFFTALTILAFLLLFEWRDDKNRFLWASILFGFAFGCLMVTKAFGLILILLLPFVVWKFWSEWRKIRTFFIAAGITFLIFFCGVWQIHFALGGTVNPSLPDNGYYQASAQYKQILQNHANGNILNFPIMLRDSMKFVGHYEQGVPRLNLCKSDENGSPWFEWPIGARSINYRWETPDGVAYKYLYLQSNPVVWLTSFAATIIAVMMLVMWFFFPGMHKPKNAFMLIVFGTLYICFMIAVAQISRVMYLYHYFTPLLFSFLLFALLADEVGQIGRWQLTEKRKTAILLAFSIAVFLGFQYYRPLTYYTPLTDTQVQQRALIPYWDLHCVHCQLNDPLVVPSGTNS